MEDLRVADIYVAQTLPYWRQQARCIRACSAVEEGGATHRRIHRSEGCCLSRHRKALERLVLWSRQVPSYSETGHLPMQKRVRIGEEL